MDLSRGILKIFEKIFKFLTSPFRLYSEDTPRITAPVDIYNYITDERESQ